jgi:RNA polymerase sigma factor (sigma-70 family)
MGYIVSSDELAGLVRRWKAGDRTVRNEIIKQTTKIALAVAKKHAKNDNIYELEDLQQQARLGLVQAVNWIPTRLDDDKFEGYAWRTCDSFCRKYLERNQTVHIPYDAFLEIVRRDGPEAIPKIWSIEAWRARDDDGPSTGHAQNPFEIPAPPIYDRDRFEDLCTILHMNPRERRVVDLRVAGHGIVEIGRRLNISKSMVFKIIEALRQRYLRKAKDNTLLLRVDPSKRIHSIAS